MARGRGRPRLGRCDLPGRRDRDLDQVRQARARPLFRWVTGQGKAVGSERLNDNEVARLVKRAAMAAGIRGNLSEVERACKFSGQSLRAGVASSAEVDERYMQKQLSHA